MRYLWGVWGRGCDRLCLMEKVWPGMGVWDSLIPSLRFHSHLRLPKTWQRWFLTAEYLSSSKEQQEKLHGSPWPSTCVLWEAFKRVQHSLKPPCQQERHLRLMFTHSTVFSKPVFFFFNSQTLESLHWHLRYGSHSATCWCAALDAGSGTFKVSFASNVLF